MPDAVEKSADDGAAARVTKLPRETWGVVKSSPDMHRVGIVPSRNTDVAAAPAADVLTSVEELL